MKKIILLNPPGKNLYIRDYYCSKTSQANYISQPIDLLVMSAGFRGGDYDVKLIDAIAENLSLKQTLKNIQDLKPDYVISLVGAVSWEEDVAFLSKIKNLINCKILGTGDILLENPEKYLNELNIFDAIITDYTTNEVEEYIRMGKTEKKILPKYPSKVFHLTGNPYHELFLKLDYRYPFTLSRKFCTVLTSFGCPFKCSFCIMGKLLYKIRETESIIEELKYIKSLDVDEIFFLDQTFGANKFKIKELLNKIIKEKLNFKWFGFSRVDVLDEEILLLMKKSGCHTLILGIESGSEKILANYRKGYTKEDIRRTLKICSKLKIRTAGTFIFGLPNETNDTANETLKFIKELPLDYASFNVAVPRAGTDLRSQAISLGLIEKDFVVMDQSGTEVAMRATQLSQEEIKAIKKRAVFSFYFRPKYILHRLAGIRTFYEFVQNLLNAIYLLKINK